MAVRGKIGLIVTGLSAGAAMAGGAPGAACPSSSEETAVVANVEPRLELVLADGRRLRLAGLDPPLGTPDDPDLAETARARLAAMVGGRRVGLSLVGAKPDRWGRLVALVFPVDSPAAEGGLATSLAAQGLGRYRAEPAAHGCRDALLAAEAKAREAKLGLWHDPYYGVLAVDDRAGFAERSGTIVVAEGRLSAVQPGPFRTTLRFAAPAQAPDAPGSFGGHMLVATILPRAMKSFGAQHMDFSAMVGRRLRFRGLLDQRFGPRIELQSPDEVEALDAPAPQN